MSNFIEEKVRPVMEGKSKDEQIAILLDAIKEVESRKFWGDYPTKEQEQEMDYYSGANNVIVRSLKARGVVTLDFGKTYRKIEQETT